MAETKGEFSGELSGGLIFEKRLGAAQMVQFVFKIPNVNQEAETLIKAKTLVADLQAMKIAPVTNKNWQDGIIETDDRNNEIKVRLNAQAYDAYCRGCYGGFWEDGGVKQVTIRQKAYSQGFIGLFPKIPIPESMHIIKAVFSDITRAEAFRMKLHGDFGLRDLATLQMPETSYLFIQPVMDENKRIRYELEYCKRDYDRYLECTDSFKQFKSRTESRLAHREAELQEQQKLAKDNLFYQKIIDRFLVLYPQKCTPAGYTLEDLNAMQIPLFRQVTAILSRNKSGRDKLHMLRQHPKAVMKSYSSDIEAGFTLMSCWTDNKPDFKAMLHATLSSSNENAAAVTSKKLNAKGCMVFLALDEVLKNKIEALKVMPDNELDAKLDKLLCNAFENAEYNYAKEGGLPITQTEVQHLSKSMQQPMAHRMWHKPLQDSGESAMKMQVQGQFVSR